VVGKFKTTIVLQPPNALTRPSKRPGEGQEEERRRVPERLESGMKESLLVKRAMFW